MRAGPRVVEALIGDAIDIGVSGPAPVLSAHARHGPGTVIVLAGVASGGASLVTRHDLSRLGGMTFATAQLGSTQDVSLRRWLAERGAKTTDRGGDVRVTALAPSVILSEMKRGNVHAAWLSEPWATRAESEGAKRAIDERDLWPNRTFASALLVARPDFVRSRPDVVDRFVQAMHEEVVGIRPDDAYAGLDQLTKGALSRPVFDAAWARVDFVADPMRASVERLMEGARALGVLPSESSCDGLFRV
jgi:NitT/TauT family transport system substrate-binding protein